MQTSTEINYFKMALAVCAGVLLAGAISSIVGLLVFSAVVESQVETMQSQTENYSRLSREAAASAREEASRQQLRQQRADEARRLASKTGKTLSRECREYSDFYANNPGVYAREQRDKACNRLRIYTETGRLTK